MKSQKLPRYSVITLETFLKHTNSPEAEANKRESRIVGVLNSSLIPGTAGHYDPHSKEGQYGADLPEPYRTFVREHETGHAHGLIDEYQTDIYAAARTGHPEFIRGPFYRPPLRTAA